MLIQKSPLLPVAAALLFASSTPIQAELVAQAELRLGHENIPLKQDLQLEINRFGFELYGERIKGLQLGLVGGWLDGSVEKLPAAAGTEQSGRYLGLRFNPAPTKSGWSTQWSSDVIYYKLDQKINQRQIDLSWGQINLNLGYGYAGEDFRIASGIEALVLDGDIKDSNGLNQQLKQKNSVGGWLEFGFRANQNGDLLIKISAPHQQMIQLSFRNSF